MKLNKLPWAIAAVSTLLAASAQAETLRFTITGDYAATWTMDSHFIPAPDDVFNGKGFFANDIRGTFPGAATDFVDLTFFNVSFEGGLQIVDYNGSGYALLETVGPQLYSGTEAAPVFSVGTYAMGELQGTGVYALTISAVPEPATVGMMLAGVGLVGVSLSRRKSVATTEV